MSLLEGREGENIAAPCVTLMDDPLLPGGFASAPFDGEGSACRTKAVIENGVLKTLLHSRKTAQKAGTVSTGNAHRSVSSPVQVAPTNFFFLPHPFLTVSRPLRSLAPPAAAGRPAGTAGMYPLDRLVSRYTSPCLLDVALH